LLRRGEECAGGTKLFPAGEVTSLYSVNHGAANRPAGVPYSADRGLLTAYSYSDVPISSDEIAAKAVAMVNGTLRKAQALATYDFIYYPRIGEHDLKAGWYERMEAMQGRRGTYHAGGLFTFWVRAALALAAFPSTHWSSSQDVEHAFRSGFDLVNRKF